MNQPNPVQEHYDIPEIAARLEDILKRAQNADGTIEPSLLAALDQFHIRGLAATRELAELAGMESGMTVLDAGSGFGGPSRYLAQTYGCQVAGVDLTPSYVAIAQMLAERTGVTDRVGYQVGDILSLPFPDASFDRIWTQHVVMNIRDRDALYREFRRAVKPGGRLAFYDVLTDDSKTEPIYPVPWAESGETSFLLTEAETKETLARAGWKPVIWRDVTAEAAAWFGEQQTAAPPPVSLVTLLGPQFAGMAANAGRSLREGRIRLVMAVCETAP